MQKPGRIRHAQTQIHSLSNYKQALNGFQNWRHQHDRVWYLSVPKIVLRRCLSAGPFEFIGRHRLRV